MDDPKDRIIRALYSIILELDPYPGPPSWYLADDLAELADTIVPADDQAACNCAEFA